MMAKELRKKIQSVITPEDILNIELQERIRELLKNNINSQVERKKYMIKIRKIQIYRNLLKIMILNRPLNMFKKNLLISNFS